MSLNHMYIYK